MTCLLIFLTLSSAEQKLLMITSSMNRDSFLSSFPICIPFVFFICLVELARISSSVLKKRDEARPPACPERGPGGGPQLQVASCSGLRREGASSRFLKELRSPRPLEVPPHPRGWRASPEAAAGPASPHQSALVSCSKFVFYLPLRPCLPSQWLRGSKEMEEKERCDRFHSVLLP